ncbi:MAG TPA: cupin domain-containing protein [Rhodopila sp.]
MAKATAPEKVKAAMQPKKKAEATAATPKKAIAAKAAPPAVAPKMTAAPKGKTPPPKQAASQKATSKKAASKKAAPKKAALKQAAPPRKAPAAKTLPPKKTAGRKTAARAGTVMVKKAAPRRPATRTAIPAPAKRRVRPPADAPKPAARKLASNPPQTFTVSHVNEADFKADGLRAYAHYRDLGIAAATGGLCQAHVIRLIPPCTDEVRKRHLHQTELQLVYVLKGWMKNEFEGHGEQMMSVGSCWLQPSGIKHTVLDYSPDCEVLEIIVPAEFRTEDAT